MPFFRSQRNNAPQQTPQQHYQSLRRGNITSAGKTATFDKLLALATSNNTTEKKIVTDVVRNLLDFKAAERAKDRNTINNSLRGVRDAIPQPNNQGLTYDECLELAKNRSGIFQRKLPDTLRRLVDDLLRLSLPSPGLITDTNRAFLIDCGLRAKVNLATTIKLKREFEEHFKKTKECLIEILTRISSPRRFEYRDIIDSAVDDISRAGGATQGTGNQEPFVCGRPMHLPPHNHNQPILQVAAEWTRLQILRTKRPDTNSLLTSSLLTSNQEVAQRRLNRLSGVVQKNPTNDFLAFDIKPVSKKNALKEETIQYLRGKGLWREDEDIATARPRLTTAHAAVAVIACTAQVVPNHLPRAFEFPIRKLWQTRRCSPGQTFLKNITITDDEHRITQDFVKFCEEHGIQISGSQWLYDSYDQTRKQLSTTVYYCIKSGLKGGAVFRLFLKESLPYRVTMDDPIFLVIEPLYDLIKIEEVDCLPPTLTSWNTLNL